MDGQIHDYHQPEQPQSSKGRRSIPIDDDYTTYETSSMKDTDDDDQTYYEQQTRRQKRSCVLFTALIVALACFVGLSVGISKSQKQKQQKHQQRSSSSNILSLQQEQLLLEDGCTQGVGTIQNSHQLQLELYVNGMDQNLVTEDEKGTFTQAVMDGYNSGANSSCHRWMFDAAILNQTVVEYDLFEFEQKRNTDTNHVLQNVFTDKNTLVVVLRTHISCYTCTSETAFALSYPIEFGNNDDGEDDGEKREGKIGLGILSSNKRSINNKGDDYRRKQRGLNQETGSATTSSLDAGMIIMAIEQMIQKEFSNVRTIQQVTIVTEGEDGSKASMTMDRSSDVNPFFFRDQSITSASDYLYDCEEDGKSGKSGKGKSGKGDSGKGKSGKGKSGKGNSGKGKSDDSGKSAAKHGNKKDLRYSGKKCDLYDDYDDDDDDGGKGGKGGKKSSDGDDDDDEYQK
jgi:hypothetical protein